MAIAGELHYLGLTELAALIKDRQLSPVAVTRAQLDRIALMDGALHSYAHVMADVAMAQAAAAEAEIAAGRYRGPLHGVPVGVKDLCWTRDAPTAAGMMIHRNHRPSEDATVVRRLREAGAVILGKLQLTEGAYSDYHPSVDPPRNPWNAEYWPGISSSGPAVATAAGLCYGSIGSDTGGSIRWPCAANGVTGVKPSWGRVSRYGVFELAPTLDHVGAIARSAADVAAMLGAIAGSDPCDPTTVLDGVPDYRAALRLSAKGLRIGIDAAWNSEDVDIEIHAVLCEAIQVFRSLGAEIIEVSFPDVRRAIVDWARNCAVEAAVAHEATYDARKDDYGPVLRKVIETGRALSGLDYQKILLRRLDLRGRVGALFHGMDLLLTPVQPLSPPTLATISTLGEQPELVHRLQRFTCPFNMTGHPTITLPGGFSGRGLPMAFQLVAGHLCEPTLLRAATGFQSATSWHCRRPTT